jgi:lipoyl(octanoyl) transferase
MDSDARSHGFTGPPTFSVNALHTRWLGRVTYQRGLEEQERLVAHHAAPGAQSSAVDTLLLLEHEPVYTIGRGGDKSSLVPGTGGGAGLPYPVVETNRGGQATFHGPGQLVGYAVLDLKKRGQDLHRHLRSLEGMVVEVCAHFGVRAGVREGLTGVWVEDRKLASIGVGVRRWISMHGFGLNVCGSLEGFTHITPCGLAGVRMTSLEAEGAGNWSVEEVAGVADRKFREVFGVEQVAGRWGDA